jgi:hypothetical protein
MEASLKASIGLGINLVISLVRNCGAACNMVLFKRRDKITRKKITVVIMIEIDLQNHCLFNGEKTDFKKQNRKQTPTIFKLNSPRVTASKMHIRNSIRLVMRSLIY